jgi:hypothetical protein
MPLVVVEQPNAVTVAVYVVLVVGLTTKDSPVPTTFVPSDQETEVIGTGAFVKIRFGLLPDNVPVVAVVELLFHNTVFGAAV